MATIYIFDNKIVNDRNKTKAAKELKLQQKKMVLHYLKAIRHMASKEFADKVIYINCKDMFQSDDLLFGPMPSFKTWFANNIDMYNCKCSIPTFINFCRIASAASLKKKYHTIDGIGRYYFCLKDIDDYTFECYCDQYI